jgi:acetyl esterase/lipase
LESVEGLRKTLEAAGKKPSFHVYPGAEHAFSMILALLIVKKLLRMHGTCD